ncbi:MAG TPA: transcriptional regulator [Actinomycetes bacterium]|nr:transcriptional regulator [Actinomycetes bacterium]
MTALDTVRRELAPAEGANRLVPLVAEGRLPRERLAALAGEEYRIIASDRRSFLVLAARFPEPPAVDFFTGLAQGESLALPMLLTFAAALGQSEKDLRAYEPKAGCQAYAAHVAWLALNGGQGDVALALVANFAAWGSYCAAVAEGLRRQYGLDDDACGFFDFFATPVPEVEQQALAVAEASLEGGQPPESARRQARLVQAYELMFWNTLAEGVG